MLFLLSINHGICQEVKKDNRISSAIEDPFNFYEEESISKTDLLKGLELLGIRIHKFDVPGSSEKNMITLLAREVKNGKEINVDTIACFSNEYRYWDIGVPDPYVDFIKEVTIFSNTEYNKSELQLELTSSIRKHKLELDNNSDEQFYVWRKYQKTHLKKGKEIPLLIFASSWIYPGEDSHRFCGVVELSEDDPMTQELLNNSPHFIRISLRVE